MELTPTKKSFAELKQLAAQLEANPEIMGRIQQAFTLFKASANNPPAQAARLDEPFMNLVKELAENTEMMRALQDDFQRFDFAPKVAKLETPGGSEDVIQAPEEQPEITQASNSLAELIKPFGKPDKEQLELINLHRPLGAAPYEDDEIMSVPIIACNNLLWHSNGVWSPNGLMDMARSYKSLAPDQTADHKWYDSTKTMGFIYDAEIIVSKTAPESYYGRGHAVSGFIADADPAAIDREIVQRDGFHQVVLYSAIQAGHPSLDAFKYRRLADVSIGALTDGKFYCPIDGTRFGSKSWMRCEHGHYMPHWLVMWFLSEEDREMLAPYYIRDRCTQAVELSAVMVGDVFGASVVKESTVIE